MTEELRETALTGSPLQNADGQLFQGLVKESFCSYPTPTPAQFASIWVHKDFHSLELRQREL